MGQNFCQQRPLQSEVDNREQKKTKPQVSNQQGQAVTQQLGSDQPHPQFATKAQTTNFLLPASVQQRFLQLKSFAYPEGPEVPTGTRLLNPYLLRNGAYYAGDWRNGKMNGKGMFVLPDKSVLTCVVKDNVISRKARIIYPNGDYFQGEVEENKANGKGKLVQGKTTYKGSFKDNLPHGAGTQTGDGYSFEGDFQAGQKKNGTLIWTTNKETLTYKGQIFNNLFHGRGTLTTKEGKYIGQFLKGEKCGRGKFYYKNHRYYEGQFDNDKRNGQGKIVDESVSKIVARGYWKDDAFLDQ